jgi:hypothetical protein
MTSNKYKVVETMLCLELPHLGQNDTYDHDELTPMIARSFTTAH